MIYQRFRIKAPFTFWDIRTRIYEVFAYKRTETIDYVKK